MKPNDKPEAVRAVEARVLMWLVRMTIFLVTPAVLFAQATEWSAGRYDAGLGALLVCHTGIVFFLILLRGTRPRAVLLALELLVAGSLAVLRFGPNMSISLAFLGAAMIVRIYVGKRAAFACFIIIAALLSAAGFVHATGGLSLYEPSAADLADPTNWVRMILTALAVIGAILLLFGLLQDGLLGAAEQAQAALERERREREERRTAELALAESQRQEIVSRVAAGAAHDLNNVLTAVMGATELAAAGSQSAAVKAELRIVSEAAQRASALTRQLLAFSRSQITQRRCARLSDIATGLAGLIQRLTPSNIDIGIEAESDACIYADPGQIEQVILNLCVNARDAMPDGGRIEVRVLEAVLEDGSPGVALRVSDTGFGIPEEIRERIFEPFFTTKSDGRGTGLGLPTVRIIVEAHQGEITCESGIGAGTTMTVRFPLAAPEDAAAEASKRSAAPREPFRGGEAVLVCDDDELVRETSRRILEPAGYTIRTAADGPSAIRAAAAQEFDLAVIDAVMPGTSGRQLYEALRRDHPEMRFLFCTGYDPGIFGQEYFDDPRHHLLSKPYGREDLLRAIRTALDGPTSAGPSPAVGG